MSNASNQTSRERREAARELVKKQRAEQQKRAQRVRLTSIIGALVVIVAVIVTIVVVNGNKKVEVTAASAAPNNLNAKQVYLPITSNTDEATPVLDLYYDYMCPICGSFEKVNGDAITTLVKDKKLNVNYHPRNFLDANSSGTEYSTRAANAAACFYDDTKGDPDKFQAFNALMFERQPEEGSKGLTTDQLKDIVKEAGAGDAAATCMDNKTYNSWVKQAEQQTAALAQAAKDDAVKQALSGTPFALINGEPVPSATWQTPDALAAAITEAQGKEHKNGFFTQLAGGTSVAADATTTGQKPVGTETEITGK